MKLLIEVGQDTYDVEVDLLDQTPGAIPRGYIPPPLRRRAKPLARLRSNGEADVDERVCRSPLRGIVARVNVEPGQRVREGEVIMVLEAMKMETDIAAPRDCTIAAVHVAPGAGVQVGQPLAEWE